MVVLEIEVCKLNITEKTLRAYREKRLLSSVTKRIGPQPALNAFAAYAKHRVYAKTEPMWTLDNLNRGLAVHYAQVALSQELFARIMTSYELMKRDQLATDPIYLPSQHWQENLTRSFRDIEVAIQSKNAEYALSFLSTFLRDRSLGISVEAGMSFQSRNERIVYLNALHALYNFWRYSYPNQDLSSIAMPLIGNPRGCYVNGYLLNTASFFNQGVAEELSSLVAGKERPVIAEIGGGYGPMGYALLRRHKDMTYIDFDLPEMLVVASYFLMTAFPDRKVLLYGEEALSRSCLDEFDIILMPNFAIDDLPPSTCDLFINQTSFGEMNRATVQRYLSHIARCCTDAFFHMNHEYQADTHSEDPGLLASKYPLSMEGFRLAYRMPHMPHYFFYREMYNEVVDIFAYLFLKRPKAGSSVHE